MKRKIKRKITIEIYKCGVHSETQTIGLYEKDLDGINTNDPFKNCINTVMVREAMLNNKIYLSLIRKILNEEDCDFVICKINKRNTQKFILTNDFTRGEK